MTGVKVSLLLAAKARVGVSVGPVAGADGDILVRCGNVRVGSVLIVAAVLTGLEVGLLVAATARVGVTVTGADGDILLRCGVDD